MITHDLIYTNTSYIDVGIVDQYDIDLSYGKDDSNDFELSTNTIIETGSIIYIDGTGFGGIIDTVAKSTGDDYYVYKGRCFEGIIDSHIIAPDPGMDYYIMPASNAGTAIEIVLERIGLLKNQDNGIFTVQHTDLTIKQYQFTRYVSSYVGLRDMLESNGLRLYIKATNGKFYITAVESKTIENTVDDNFIDFDIQVDNTSVNHLVCLGSGELANRTVINLYADEDGNISKTQSIYGSLERTEIYDYNNADDDELLEEGTKKLLEYQSKGSVAIDSISPGISADVGDIVLANDNSGNMSVSSKIEGIVVQASQVSLSVSYTAGDAIVA